MMRSIRKKIKETPIIGRIVDSLKSSNPRENAPSIQAVLDQIGIRENLLINADFRYHIINQWGQDYYTSSYSVDMWHVSGSGRISLKNNRLDVQLWKSDSVEGAAQLKQILEVQVKGVHTYTVNLKACTSYCKMYIKNSNGEIIEQYVNVGINSLTYTGTLVPHL